MSNSRTSVVKNLELEGFLYGVLHNSDDKYKFGVVQTVYITGATTLVNDPGDEYSTFLSVSGDVDAYVRLVTPNEQSSACTLTISGESIEIPAGTPAGRGIKIYVSGDTPVDVTATPTVTDGLTGLILEIVYVPQFSSSHLLNFIEEFNTPMPEEWRIIRNKGKYDHKKRLATVDRRINGSFLFTNFTEGMHKFANQLTTMKFEVKDNGAGVVSESIYYGHVLMKESDQNRPGGADANMTSNFDGTYERWMTVVGE